MLLLHRHATVTVCHSRTQDLPRVAATGDILVAALGRPGFVRRAFVKPGATVIDVGINLVTDAKVAREIFHEGHPRRGLFERKGSVLVGDVHPEVAEVAGALTPVPGGVGPLTIAMLMANTIKAAELRLAAGT
jgi:methylenetetrahydrofolate dehydrogenase (NADP+) / methenyltetrahydrofolate cyclohydrolase